jgi:hypothetical protein
MAITEAQLQAATDNAETIATAAHTIQHLVRKYRSRVWQDDASPIELTAGQKQSLLQKYQDLKDQMQAAFLAMP